jgi:hypothetical protein
MKFYIRRLVVGIITSPISMALYALLYFALVVLGASESSWKYLVVNLPAIAWAHVVAVTFLPNIMRVVDRLIGK